MKGVIFLFDLLTSFKSHVKELSNDLWLVTRGGRELHLKFWNFFVKSFFETDYTVGEENVYAVKQLQTL